MSLGISSPMAGPGLGIWFGYSDARVMNRGGATARGELVMFDLTAADGDNNTTGFTGKEDDGYASVIKPAATVVSGGATTTLLGFGFFALAVEAMANDAKGRVQTRGVFAKAVVDNNVVAGDVLVALAANDLTRILPATGILNGHKYLAIALEAEGVTLLADVLFNGIEGFGNSNTIA